MSSARDDSGRDTTPIQSNFYTASEITRLLKLIHARHIKSGTDMEFYRLHNGEHLTLIHPTDKNQNGDLLYRADYMSEWIQDLINLLNGDLPVDTKAPALKAIKNAYMKVVPLVEARKQLDEKRAAVADLRYTHDELVLMATTGTGAEATFTIELRTRMLRDGLLSEKPGGYHKTPKLAMLLKQHKIA